MGEEGRHFFKAAAANRVQFLNNKGVTHCKFYLYINIYKFLRLRLGKKLNKKILTKQGISY